DAEHTSGLARRRAQPTGELREVVRGVQPLDGLTPVAFPRQVVPLRDQVAERATVVAERNTAVHAASGLLLQLADLLLLVDLTPVHQPQRHRAALGQRSLTRC